MVSLWVSANESNIILSDTKSLLSAIDGRRFASRQTSKGFLNPGRELRHDQSPRLVAGNRFTVIYCGSSKIFRGT